MAASSFSGEETAVVGPNKLSNFILGSQDGLVNVLGILLGLSAATTDLRLVFVAAFAALGAESISMGAVAYTSTLARRRQYLKGIAMEDTGIKNTPSLEKGEVREIFSRWGYTGKKLEQATEMIVNNPKAWLAFMMSNELNLRACQRVGASHELSDCPRFDGPRLAHPTCPVFPTGRRACRERVGFSYRVWGCPFLRWIL